jgi:hypothetical protein
LSNIPISTPGWSFQVHPETLRFLELIFIVNTWHFPSSAFGESCPKHPFRAPAISAEIDNGPSLNMSERSEFSGTLLHIWRTSDATYIILYPLIPLCRVMSVFHPDVSFFRWQSFSMGAASGQCLISFRVGALTCSAYLWNIYICIYMLCICEISHGTSSPNLKQLITTCEISHMFMHFAVSWQQIFCLHKSREPFWDRPSAKITSELHQET